MRRDEPTNSPETSQPVVQKSVLQQSFAGVYASSREMEQAVSYASTRFSNAKTNATLPWLLVCFRAARRRRFVDARLGWASWLVFSCLESRRRVVHRTLQLWTTASTQSTPPLGANRAAAPRWLREGCPGGSHLGGSSVDVLVTRPLTTPGTPPPLDESLGSPRRAPVDCAVLRVPRGSGQRSAIDASTRVPPGPRRPVCPPHRRPTASDACSRPEPTATNGAYVSGDAGPRE